ncbi:MAG: nucleotidyltransferase domain-containing protein [Elusimicrobiota bacterium]
MRRFFLAVLAAGTLLGAYSPARAQSSARVVVVPGASAWTAALAAPAGSPYLQGLSQDLTAHGALESFSCVLAQAQLLPAQAAALPPSRQKALIRSTIQTYAAQRLKDSARLSRSGASLLDSVQALRELDAVRRVFPQDVPASVGRSVQEAQERLDRRYDALTRSLRGEAGPDSVGELAAAFELSVMARKAELPDPALTALAAATSHRNPNIAKEAAEALYQQRALPAGALERLSAGGPAAAKLLLLHRPGDARALETIRRHNEAKSPIDDWRDLRFATLEAGRDPAARPVSPAEILDLARAVFRSYNPAADKKARGAFERFLSRAARYAASPRRLYKFLDGLFSFQERAPWDSQLRRPEAARGRDLKFKARVLARLRVFLPGLLAEANLERESLGEAGDIAGVLLVGSVATGQPTEGSDLDLVPVLKGGIPIEWKTYALENYLDGYLSVNKLAIHHSDWLDPVRLDSLRFREYQALGAVFIPAAH